MKVFVTGASGWIGSGVIPELVSAGHQVTGLARSDRSSDAVVELGADVHRGELGDLDSLRDAAAEADAVVHLGYNHDFSQMAAAADLDRAAIGAMADVLAPRGGALLVASGIVGLSDGGRPATERDMPDPSAHPRMATGAIVMELAERGVRSVLVRFAPTVHGEGDRGFMATLSELARRSRAAAYVGDGSNRWTAVNRADAAVLVRLAVEQARPGTVVHAVAEEGIATRQIADALARAVKVETESVPVEQSAQRFGWIGGFWSLDVPASSALTRERLGWTPSHQGLVEDIDAGYYTDVEPHSSAG